MNSYYTPESSPVSSIDRGIEMFHPIDCSTPVVLDLCIRRTSQSTPSPSRAGVPENKNDHRSPSVSESNFPNPFLINSSPQLPAIPSLHYPTQNAKIKPEPISPLANQHVHPTNLPASIHPVADSSNEEISTTKTILPDTTIPFHLLNPTSLSLMAATSPAIVRCGTTRPFKAYPKDPTILSTTGGRTHTEALLNQESRESYAEFRRRMLAQVNNNNSITNPKMRRSSSRNSNSDDFSNNNHHGSEKDAAYWERRRKNNEAAKRSRDARRAKEDEIAIRAAFLEHENMRLKIECAALREEVAELRALIT